MTHRRSARWVVGAVIALVLTAVAAQSGFSQDATPPHPLGDIPLSPETYLAHMRFMPRDVAAELPSAYDARTDGIVTAAKNQGSCGSCWAFATTGAMESHLLRAGFVSGSPDLAEQQQVSCNTSQSGCCGGSSNAAQFWTTRGPVYESCFGYRDGGTSCPTNSNVPCSNGSGCEELPYRVTGWYTVSPTPTEFKTSLYTFGPSYWRFDVYTDFDSYWSGGSPGQVYVSKAGATYRGGHAVLLIGWDDAKGAYLCKNSWGGGGPNHDGTFWIAYTGHYNNLGFGMANFSVVSAIACSQDSQCSDNNACTTDVCTNPGTAQAACSHNWALCGAADGCCGPSCTWPVDPDCHCGNQICEQGENCQTCPGDCPSGQGGSCSSCFKGKCDGACNPAKEDASCRDCAPSWCCGNGTCEAGESSDNCALDCPNLCGNGKCDPGETACTCSDCGPKPTAETSCSNGVDDDCDGQIDCADGDCADNAACCLGKGAACSTASQCCSNNCRARKCQ